MPEIFMKYIRANGLDFAYLEAGQGPLVLLLHGFPDIPKTWEHQINALASAGYRAVAPSLRGYFPTEITPHGFYDKATLATDIAELIKVLGKGQAAYLVGQDWGAIIGYAVLAAFPELVEKAVLMAVPHPALANRSLLDAKHVHRSFHWWFFQMPNLPEQAIIENDYAFIDYLWRYWTAPGHEDVAHIEEIKRVLAVPGVLTATLAYYRAMFDVNAGDPALHELRERMNRLISVPTLALCGAEDLRADLMMNQSEHFTGAYRFELIGGAGHFPQREQPAQVTRLILDWFGSPKRDARQ
jgi:pimeloyl-ACP methyl ester carboxylesterase